MREFGDKSTFAIAYENYVELYPEDPDILAEPQKFETGGSIYFWVKGKNLFERTNVRSPSRQARRGRQRNWSDFLSH